MFFLTGHRYDSFYDEVYKHRHKPQRATHNDISNQD